MRLRMIVLGMASLPANTSQRRTFRLQLSGASHSGSVSPMCVGDPNAAVRIRVAAANVEGCQSKQLYCIRRHLQVVRSYIAGIEPGQQREQLAPLRLVGAVEAELG